MGKRSKTKASAQDNDESTLNSQNDKITEDASDDVENNTNKRALDESDHDSETEVQAKKPKKKKKIPVSTEDSEGGNKKSKKSIRQIKRERYAKRQAEAAAHSKDQLKSQCLNYLSQWKHDRQNWKFMKIKQVWLFKNKFSKALVPESSWPVLLEYFESSQGNIRKMLLDDAHKIIKQMDEWTESQDNDNDVKDENDDSEETTVTKPDDVIYSRARSLIQCLQE